MDKIRKLIENLAKRIRPRKNEPVLDVNVEEAGGDVEKGGEIDIGSRRLEGSGKKRRPAVSHDD